MDELGRYYTDSKFSKLLVNQLNTKTPAHILDLGVGDGALLNAAIDKWNKAYYSVVDIEEKTFVKNPRINFTKKDLLNFSEELTLNLFNDQIDIAICNPPYKKIKNSKLYAKLFYDIGFRSCTNLKYLTSDLLFLAFNLSLLKKGGQLGIILPDTLMTSFDFELFRKDLLQYDIISIIELPEQIFKKTEAKTYILVLNNILNENKFTHLFQANKSGNIISKKRIPSNYLIKRMDFSFYFFKNNQIKNSISLKEIGAKISRGRNSKKELQNLEIPFFHTSNFNLKNEVYFPPTKLQAENNFAIKNDILIARVGSRCVGKFCLVKSGERTISDCILKVSLREEFVLLFFNALNSDYGKNWFRAYSHGVCAKVISKNDLLDFRIPLP